MCDELSTLAETLRSISVERPDGAELFDRIVGEMRREVEFVFSSSEEAGREARWTSWSEAECGVPSE
ncbi:MAG TPA: hypothetical protein VGS98_03320 [Thermoanaerobaculia bacterium]|jgi:hypothetical protein|nr:hypothetical protein [Thermoanaerobaculia bacterium]